MGIGAKIKDLRLKHGLTQGDLAGRCELTKGYISQLENDLTSPSISTLEDILISLGSGLNEFFSDEQKDPIVFKRSDYFEKETDLYNLSWLVPASQKNAMEPILIELRPQACSERDLPHEGEEFGYVLKGKIILIIGKQKYIVNTGESFYYRAGREHYMQNTGNENALVLWVSCPPNF